MSKPPIVQRLLEPVTLIGALLIIFVYIYALLIRIPYAGLGWDFRNGQVLTMYVDESAQSALRPGDWLLQVGSVRFGDFHAGLLFDGLRVGEKVPILIERNGQTMRTDWVFPGRTAGELVQRLVSTWWLSLVFWGAALATSALMRPKDTSWWLLMAFCLLTAIWLAAGMVSGLQIWLSAFVLRSVGWLCVPVFVHFHWDFVRPLGRLPTWVWALLYMPFLALAVVEWIAPLPLKLSILGFALALLASAILLALHVIVQRTARRDTSILLLLVAVGLLPIAILGGAYALGLPIGNAAYIAVMGLAVVPMAYFYVAYRRQVPNLEVRANPLIAAYLYVIALGTLLLLLILAAESWLPFPGSITLIAWGAALLATVVTVFVYRRFRSWVQRHLLGVPLAPTHLLHEYAARITTTFALPGLIDVLTGEVLPSLLVRQSALLWLDEDEKGGVNVTTLYREGVREEDLPTAQEVAELLALGGQYRPPATTSNLCPWVRLVLPLSIGQRRLGLWLFGRRDPDDYYDLVEIPTLRILAAQTAVALTNIDQSERLQALYRANIDRHEGERMQMARELHDEVLNQLAALSMTLDEEDAPPEFHARYEAVIQRIRQMVSELRPAMLSFGLAPALEELADRDPPGAAVQCDLMASGARYSQQVEQHLFRIVQQAVENALRHAQARSIRILGRLDPEQVDLTVADDGIGFAVGGALDISDLLAHRHFGLAGMYERAEIIGARVDIQSTPGQGTRVRVRWSAESITPSGP